MRGTLEVALKANLHPRHQHCTDEAQKVETVLSAVSYIYIYNYMNYFCTFIYIDIFLIFFTKLHYLHHSQYNTQFTVQAYI